MAFKPDVFVLPHRDPVHDYRRRKSGVIECPPKQLLDSRSEHIQDFNQQFANDLLKFHGVKPDSFADKIQLAMNSRDRHFGIDAIDFERLWGGTPTSHRPRLAGPERA